MISRYLPYFLIITLLFMLGCEGQQASLTVVRQPAEFEPVEAVWLIWPPVDHTAGTSNSEVTMSIVDALIDHVEVVVTCANDALCAQAKERLAARFKESSNLTLKKIPSVELWARDMGPTFVETNGSSLAIADFGFNAWGYSDTTDADAIIEERYDERVAAALNIPIISTSLISEGGNREVNGKGTLILTETVEKGRNPHMSLEEMEAEYARVLGISKTIWLKEGLREDDHTFLGPITTEDGRQAYTVVTTNGHIDEFARFVNDSTVLLAQVDSADFEDPIAYENHLRMEENYQILKAATDQDGQPLHIVRMPLPKTMISSMKPGDSVYEYIKTLNYTDGSVFPEGDTITVIAAASYLNFLITTETVIGQKYWREGLDEDIRERDERAKSILESLYPERKVVMLDALAVNLGGGGIHCITMQQPKLSKP